jgi:hypothetical protein
MQSRGRGQIALEFIVVYSIVLVIFVLVFTVISSQRATILNAQQDSIARIEAQEIVTYIDRAISAGSGYSTALSLAQGPGSIPYNIYISSSGVVIVNSSAASQPVSAYAFSDGRNMSINGSLQYSGQGIGVYLIPSYTGSIKISNIGGTVYIDKNPVSNAGLLGSGILSNVQEGYAPIFTGAGTGITIPSVNIGTSAMTIDTWIYPASTTQFGTVVQDGTVALNINQGPNDEFFCWIGGSDTAVAYGPANTWYNVACTYNLSFISIYINGVKVATSSDGSAYSSGATTIGEYGHGQYFLGSLENLQIYNASLNASQIYSLYSKGMFGTPVQGNNIAAWWQLDGSTNDYSGNAYNGQANAIVWQTVAFLGDRLLARNGTMLSNVPVGFVISNGIAQGGGAGIARSYNGLANPVFTYNAINTNATAYAFNYNQTTTANLIGWWPLTFGEQGPSNIVYDLSGGSENGIGAYVIGASNTPTAIQWSLPVASSRFSAAKFQGSTIGVITVNALGSLTNITALNNFTLVSWIKYNAGSSQNCLGVFGSGGETGSGLQLNAKTASSTCGIGYIGGVALPGNYPTPLYNLNWTMVSMSWSGLANSLYVFENNAVAAANTIVGSSGISPTGSQYFIGAQSATASNTFNGPISNVQLYSKALNLQQISRLYAQGPTGVPLVGSGLSGWWPLSGSTTDFSGGNNGTLAYNALFGLSNYTFSYNASPQARVAAFNGGDGVKIMTRSGVLPTGPFTVSLWFSTFNSPSQTFDYELLDGQLPNSNAYDVQLCGNSDCSGLTAGIHGNIGTGTASLSGAVNYPFYFVPYRRYNLVEQFSGTRWSIYLNGINVSTGTYSGTPSMAGSGDYLVVGGGNAAGSYFVGQIYGVQVYNSLLSAAQIAQMYQQGPGQQTSTTLSMG